MADGWLHVATPDDRLNVTTKRPAGHSIGTWQCQVHWQMGTHRRTRRARGSAFIALVVLVVAAHLGAAGCVREAALAGSGAPAATSHEGAGGAATASSRQKAPLTESVIIVAIDGVRWQDVFLGVEPELAEDQGLDRDMRLPPERLIPNIHQRVIGQGAAIGAPNCGAPMTVLNRDYVSLPGYLEMLTGQATHCTTNDCGATTIPTIAEAFRDELRVAPGRIGFISS